MAFLMNGIEVVNSMKEKLLNETKELRQKGIVPCLSIVRIGKRPDDLSYERGAIKRCEGLGINCRVFELDENITQEQFIYELKKINDDLSIHGILLFRPLPKQINEDEIKYIINANKDVDCLNPVNVAKVFEGDDSGFFPCTPEAVVEMLKHYNIEICGKNVVVLGRSLVVGKPLSMLLLKENATVTICHTKTKNIKDVCKSAEILIAACGRAKMVTKEYVSSGQVVIDVGINLDKDGNLCGDVDFGEVEKIVECITPVPGGVGTVTTSILARHVIKAAGRLNNI